MVGLSVRRISVARRSLPGPSRKVRGKIIKQDEWNEYRIRVKGPRVQLWINGTQTVDYTEADDKIEQKGLHRRADPRRAAQ